MTARLQALLRHQASTLSRTPSRTADSVNPDSGSIRQFTYRIAGFDQTAALEVVVYAQIIAAAGGDPYPAVNGG